MERQLLEVATKLEKASQAHAGQAKILRSLIKNGKNKKSKVKRQNMSRR